MRAWLLDAPWWAHGLVAGGLFGTGMGLFSWLRGDTSGMAAVVAGVLAGVFFGVVTGPWTARHNRRLRETTTTGSAEAVRDAARAAWRGPLPDDPDLRAAAHRMAVVQREQLVRQRRWAIPFFVAMIGLDLWLAFDRSPWWSLAGLVPAVILAGHLLVPRRLERRAEQLRAPAGGTG